MSYDKQIISDIAELKSTMRSLGLYERPAGRVVLCWLYNLALILGGLAVFVFSDALWLRIPAIVLSTLGLLGNATIAHSASHGSISDSSALNTFLFYFGFPFMLMVSAKYWNRSHIRVHHPAPNVIGVDDDSDLSPFFALNERDVAGAGPARRWFFRYQGYLIPFLIVFNGFNVQRTGWTLLVRELFDPGKRTASHWADLAAMFAHVLVWIGLPMLFFPMIDVLLVYVLRIVLMGYAMFAAFAAAHFPAEAICIDPDQRENFDFNFRTGFFGRLACNGVEYQIEHHIFPNISHIHYPRLSPLMRDFCARHGMPYRTLGWGEAIWKSYLVFFRPKPVLSDLESMRLAPAGSGA